MAMKKGSARRGRASDSIREQGDKRSKQRSSRGDEREPLARPKASRERAPGPSTQREASREEVVILAEPWGPSWLPRALSFAGASYLIILALYGLSPSLPRNILPGGILFYFQTACLFPTASMRAIDYRLEGWVCEAQRFEELDTRGYFPIHPDDKENRLSRVGHFYRQNRAVLQELERYVLAQELGRGAKLGGVRLSSLRIPFAEVGGEVKRWERRPLSEYPEDQVKHWFYTPVSRRRAQCGAEAQGGGGSPLLPEKSQEEIAPAEDKGEEPGLSGEGT